VDLFSATLPRRLPAGWEARSGTATPTAATGTRANGSARARASRCGNDPRQM
jgi:hypothetical protein